MNGDEQDGIAE